MKDTSDSHTYKYIYIYIYIYVNIYIYIYASRGLKLLEWREFELEEPEGCGPGGARRARGGIWLGRSSDTAASRHDPGTGRVLGGKHPPSVTCTKTIKYVSVLLITTPSITLDPGVRHTNMHSYLGSRLADAAVELPSSPEC